MRLIRVIVIYLKTVYGQADGWTDRHGAYRKKTNLKKSCNMLRFNLFGKMHAVPNVCQKDSHIELEHLLP